MKFTLRFYNQYGELEAECEAFLLQTFFEFITDYLDGNGLIQVTRAADGAFEIRELAQVRA